MKNKEVRVFSPEFRATESDGVKRISGYAALFNSWSEDLGWFRERIAPGAFSNAIQRSDAVALFNHDPNIVLGRESSGTLRLKEDDTGLYMEVDLPNTQAANDLYTLVSRGDIHQQSFGFVVKASQRTEGKGNDLDERTIVEIERLLDVSPVTFPAYPDTTVAKRSLEQHKTSATAGNEDISATAENEDIEIQLIINKHEGNHVD